MKNKVVMTYRFDKRTCLLLMLSAGLMGNFSCSSDEAEENAYMPGESVKTQFSITIPYAQKYGRMTAENTQYTGQPFLGIDNMLLLPFNTGGPGALVDAETPLLEQKKVELESIRPEFAEGGSNPNNPAMKAKLYKDVEIPSGTTAFLFYGESAKKGDPFTNGRLVRHTEQIGKPKDIIFDLQPIVNFTANDIAGKSTDAQDMLNLLNGILAVQEWKKYEHQTGHSLYEAYWEFKNNNAASARSVRAFLQDIYNLMAKVVADQGGKTKADDDGKACANAVMAAITSAGAGRAQLRARAATPEDHTQNAWVLEYVHADYTFPENMNLPDGAVQVAFSENDNNFVFASKDLSGNGIYMSEYNEFVYPPSLYYCVNSPLAVSSASSSNFTTSSNWTEFLKSYDNNGANATVSGSTFSIAMKEPVQYAVGIMESRVRIGDVYLVDSKGKQVDQPDFVLTGIMVGGVKKANWKFQPLIASNIYYTIYDRDMPAGMKKLQRMNYTVSNYTLVLPTMDGTQVDGKIKVSLEFMNNSGDFHGFEKKLIPQKTRFYLVAELDVEGTGVTNNKGRVFMSDHITEANFTLGANALKNAYNVVPDLRATKLELGVAVDLKWKPGLDFGSIGI